MRFSRPAIAGLLLCLGSAPAFAEADWFASLYTGDGVELRADERVFTLYAILNAMGYDRAPEVREQPLPKYQFDPVRRDVRLKLGALDPAVRTEVDAFFDAHPVPLVRYLAYSVSTAGPPFDTAPKGREFSDLKGLNALLQDAYGRWKLQELFGQHQAEYRKGLKGYLPVIDAPLAKARSILRVPENGPGSLLVLNLLDGKGEADGVMGDGQVVLVVGPSEKPNVEGVVREYARVLLEPQLAKKAQGGWPGGPGLLREAQAAGATETTVGDYATALFARAVALKATDAPDSAYEAAAQKGYYGLKEIARGFDEGRPVEGWALDALARAETRRPGKR